MAHRLLLEPGRGGASPQEVTEIAGLDFESLWQSNYPEGVPRHLDYPEIPLHGLLEKAARDFPDNTATVFMGGRLTYRRLLDKVDRFATALAGLGVRKGDRVGIMLPNCPQMLIAYYGTLRAGGVVVAFNPLYVEREIHRQLVDSGTRVMVVLDSLFSRLAGVRQAAGLEKCIWTSIHDFLPFPLRQFHHAKAGRSGAPAEAAPNAPGDYRFTALLGTHPPSPPDVAFDPAEDVSCLLYTGGTTGVPKGCMLTHRNMVANALQVSSWTSTARRGRERILTALPLFHSYGMTCCMNLATALAASEILLPRFVVDDVLRAIARHKPTLFPGVPTMYVAINTHPDAGKYDLRSVRACLSGSAPLPAEVQKKFQDITGGYLKEGYGLSEASPVTHVNPLSGRSKPGSIGLPLPGTTCRILDLETGEKEMPVGQAGELVVRGPQVMKGYWGQPGDTRKVLRNGWLYTGDIARMDGDGYTYIAGRKKDLIISRGYSVYPREIEEVLYEHPKILEAAAIGIPDEYRGEIVKVFVVPKPGQPLTTDEVLGHCRERLARYKVPEAVEFRPELPKAAAGKIDKQSLAEQERRAGGKRPD